jgi:hypothetical protein
MFPLYLQLAIEAHVVQILSVVLVQAWGLAP